MPEIRIAPDALTRFTVAALRALGSDEGEARIVADDLVAANLAGHDSHGVGMLPAYALYWRTPLRPEQATTRRYLTWILAFLVWWSFIVGHVLNNIKGLLP